MKVLKNDELRSVDAGRTVTRRCGNCHKKIKFQSNFAFMDNTMFILARYKHINSGKCVG